MEQNTVIYKKNRQNLPCTVRFPKPAKINGTMAGNHINIHNHLQHLHHLHHHHRHRHLHGHLAHHNITTREKKKVREGHT